EQSFVRIETNEIVRELSLVEEKDTGAAVRHFFLSSSAAEPVLPLPATELDKAMHTLVILLITRPLLADQSAIKGLEKIAQASRASESRRCLIMLGTSEEVLGALRRGADVTALKDLQGWSVEKLGEYPLRPVYAAILALSKAHQILDPDSAAAGRSQTKAR